MIECFFDGCVYPRNPGGRGGYGIIVRRDFETVHTECGFMGQWPALSNNCAEYAGVISVFRYLIREAIAEALVQGDSALVIDQMNYQMRAKHGANASLKSSCKTRLFQLAMRIASLLFQARDPCRLCLKRAIRIS